MSPARAPKRSHASASASQRPSKNKRLRSADRAFNYDVYEAADPDQEARKLLARRGGGGGDVGRTLDDVGSLELGTDHIDEEDDEEIDEDEAFDDEDEERFGIFFQNSNNSSKKKHKNKAVVSGEIDLDEGFKEEEENDSDEEEEDEEDGEYMDLSEMLNNSNSSAAAKNVDETKPLKKTIEKRSSGVSSLLPDEFESMSDSENNSENDSEKDSENNSENDSEDNLDQLAQFVHALDGNSQRRRKRLPEMTEALEESEFDISSIDASGGARAKIALHDLVGAVGDDRGFGDLKKQIESFGRSAAKQAVSAPLPKRLQDRLTRQTAYEESKKEVSLWTEIVKKNRESDHLVFPANQKPAENLTSSALVSKFEPVTDLEKEIQSMLVQSGLLEKKQREAEELELNRISKEEVAARQKELARMRALMFYEEQKQKRIAKIKSKTFRKIRKKDQQKTDVSVDDLAQVDSDLARQEVERLELERVKERMTLKHKNTGKWAKQMLGRHDNTGESRQAISEQLRRHEELRKKVSGVDSDDSDNDDDGDARLTGLNELENLVKEVDGDEEAPTKGLFAMKFMQRNLERQKQSTRDALRAAREDLEEEEENENDQEEPKETNAIVGRAVHGMKSDKRNKSVQVDKEEEEEASVEAVLDHDNSHSVRASGPVTISVSGKTDVGFKASVVAQKPLFAVEAFEVEKGENVFVGTVSSAAATTVSKPTPVVAEKKKKSVAKEIPQIESEVDEDVPVESNPWLVDANDVVVSKKSVKSSGQGRRDGQESALAKLSKNVQKIRKGNRDEEDDEMRLEGMDESVVVSNRSSQISKNEIVSDKFVEADVMDDSDDDSDMDESARVFGKSSNGNLCKRGNLPSQVDLMRMAFAADDISSDFAAEKKKALAEDAPTDAVFESMPGWGSWSGPCVQERKKNPKKNPKEEMHLRKDSHLNNVIICEKKNSKLSKYLLSDVPHGFESANQFNQTMRMPLGREWNSAQGMRRLVAPRIQTKLGGVIAPLSFEVVKNKKNQTKRPKKSL